MTQSQEKSTYASDADLIEAYEQELLEDAKEATAKEKLAAQSLHSALFNEYGEVRDGAEVILGDQ